VTNQERKRVYRLWLEGVYTRDLAAQYGVNRTTIRSVVREELDAEIKRLLRGSVVLPRNDQDS